MPEIIQTASLLKKERESLGLTLKEVSNKMGFSHYQILSSIESGQAGPESMGIGRPGQDLSSGYQLFPFPGGAEKR